LLFLMSDNCVQIAVQSLSGEVSPFLVSSNANILEVKEQIAADLPIPMQYQMLLVDSTTAADSDKLAQYCQDATETLQMTVLVSRDLVTSDVKLLNQGTASAETIIKILASLSRLGAKCGEDVVDVIAKQVESSDADVRVAAWNALEQVTRKGDAYAIVTVSSLLESSNAEIRDLAKHLLGRIADKGDEVVLSEMILRLGHTDDDVASVALELLGLFAYKRCRSAVSAVCELLEHDALRWAAVEMLGKLVEMGDKFALSLLRGYAKSQNRNVRWAAVEAMGRYVYDSA